MIHKNSFSKFIRNFFVLSLIVIFIIPGCGGGGGGSSNAGSSANTALTALSINSTVQSDGSVYYTGSYGGTQLRFSHQGAAGQGQWAVFTGTATNRIRTTISDANGLQEILAMDTGIRTTINSVGTSRVEYRTYDGNGSYLYGTVLYPVGSSWMMGRMLSAAFPGLNNLVQVVDVTALIATGKTTIAQYLPSKTWDINFLSSAYAAGLPTIPALGDPNFLSFPGSIIVGTIWNAGVVFLGYAAVTAGLVTPPVAAVGVVLYFINRYGTASGAEIPIAYGPPNQTPPPTIQIVNTSPSPTNTAEYTAITNPTVYTTTPAPVVPPPLPPCTSPNVLQNSICVTPTPVANLALNPTNPAVLQGAAVQLSTTATDSSGNLLNPQDLIWAPSNSSVATVDATGLVTGVGVGTTNISVTDQNSGVTASTSITVTSFKLTISPANPSILPANTSQLTVAATDYLGNSISLPSGLQWSSSNTSLATVNSTGLVNAIALGTITITVTDPTSLVTTSTTVQISFEITPATPVVGIGQTISLSITTINPPPTTIYWTSSDTSVATVDSSGLVTGVNLGTATISAHDPFSGITATDVVTVSDFFIYLTSATCVSAGTIVMPGDPNPNAIPELYSHFTGTGIAAGPVGAYIFFGTIPSGGIALSAPMYSTCGSWTAVYNYLGVAPLFCSRGPNDPPTTSFTGTAYDLTYSNSSTDPLNLVMTHITPYWVNAVQASIGSGSTYTGGPATIPFMNFMNLPVSCP